jgi:hypothetical protein
MKDLIINLGIFILDLEHSIIVWFVDSIMQAPPCEPIIHVESISTTFIISCWCQVVDPLC